MFAVQVRFLDAIEQPETVILRRLYATIGSRENCHLIIEGNGELPWELRIKRGIGTRFFLQRGSIRGDQFFLKEEREHVSYGTIVLDGMEFFIYCIDAQISNIYLEQLDSQLGKIPASFLVGSGDLFPVLYSVMEPKVALTMCTLEKILIGRSRKCLFRLEDKDLLPEHLELTHHGHDWTVNSVSAASKLILNGKVTTGRSILHSGDRLSIGSSELLYLDSEADLNRFSEEVGYSLSEQSSLRSGYLSIEEGPEAPKSIPLVENKVFTIGRDPSYSLWIDKYFISRLHCTLVPRADCLEITDFSSNGTSVNGQKLLKDTVSIIKEPVVEIILGPGVRLKYLSGSSVLRQDSLPSNDQNEDDLVQNESYFNEPISDEAMEGAKNMDARPRSFTEYRKKTLRQMEESSSYGKASSPFMLEGNMDGNTEVPIQIGLTRHVPQLFIAVLILVLCAVFVFLAKNIIL